MELLDHLEVAKLFLTGATGHLFLIRERVTHALVGDEIATNPLVTGI